MTIEEPMTVEDGWSNEDLPRWVEEYLLVRGRAPTPRRLKLMRFEEITPRTHNRYLIKGLLDRGALSLVYGDAGSGKTFLALDIALHCALSRPWFGRRVAGGSAIYVAAEGAGGLLNRVTAFKRHLRIEGSIPFAVLPTSVDLCETDDDTDELVTLISETNLGAPPALVVIDTLARSMAGGNENAPDDMGAFIQHVDHIREATGAHVLVVHHAGKNLVKGARGHSSLRAAVDTEIEVSRRDGGSVARVTKQKEAITEGHVLFALREVTIGQDNDGEVLKSCVVVAEENITQDDDLSPQQQMIFNIVQELIAEAGEHVDEPGHIPSTAKCVKRQVWRDRSLTTPIAEHPDARARAFSRALKKLASMGVIGTHEEWVWLQVG